LYLRLLKSLLKQGVLDVKDEDDIKEPKVEELKTKIIKNDIQKANDEVKDYK
jgi:hypothetical protein